MHDTSPHTQHQREDTHTHTHNTWQHCDVRLTSYRKRCTRLANGTEWLYGITQPAQVLERVQLRIMSAVFSESQTLKASSQFVMGRSITLDSASASTICWIAAGVWQQTTDTAAFTAHHKDKW